MSHWLLDTLDESRQDALAQATRAQIYRELLNPVLKIDYELIRRVAEGLELAVLDLELDGVRDDEVKLCSLKLAATDAFRLFRVLPRPEDPLDAGLFLLKTCSLAVLGDKSPDAARWMREEVWPELPIDSTDWAQRTWGTVIDIWLRLIRKDGWSDRDAVLERIKQLRDSQAEFEKTYLYDQSSEFAKAAALELIGLYHLAKAAEIFAHYITDGVVDGKYQIHQLLDIHFDRALAVCKHVQMIELEPLSRLLAATAAQMADNSIWTVTRAVNSRVTQFVRSLVDRGRGNRAIFDVLPPQRRALAERGLLGSSRRAVVVSLPTSSGKTLIAEFRMLQALNQFDHERGWVAYLAPTRTLVNQVARQLRKDFEPLNIIVEQVSPALEIDSVEAELLHQRDRKNEFRVLVTTPEKLDLMLRQGWEEEIGRPLTLVIVDEAHNIQGARRGLKLELLLATINNECQRAQFLLLTPFIDNAREVARWLGGQNSEDISLALDWQPNDRVIGIVQAQKGAAINGRSFDYRVCMETVHTTRSTLAVDEILTMPKNTEIAATYSKASDHGALTAITAQGLQERGPVIVMHATPDWVWSLDERFKIEANRKAPGRKVELVQNFLKLEFGETFPLIELIEFGIGVHHGGLSDEVRALMEWLFEEGELRFLVATTTIAQGVNFPVSGVVMASHQYPVNTPMHWMDMPSEDFWNIAGRAGRVSQGRLGVIALIAKDDGDAGVLREFIGKQSGELNSALITLAMEAGEKLNDLGAIVYSQPEWSTFVQYLAHTYRQMGEPDSFIDEIEQVLRNTFGFEKLRSQNPILADRLLDGVRTYTQYLQKPGRPIKLVDSTGFSLQSIMTVLAAAGESGISAESWNANSLFSQGNRELQAMMGILLKVPELRENLKAVTGGKVADGDKLALIVKDWVNGESVSNIAKRYFLESSKSVMHAMNRCGQNLFGRLTSTSAWGLGALLSITGGGLPEEQLQTLRNLPSRVYYGVSTDEAITLRLLGVPRTAATRLAESMTREFSQPLPSIRAHLRSMSEDAWCHSLGAVEGAVYRQVWRILEGVE